MMLSCSKTTHKACSKLQNLLDNCPFNLRSCANRRCCVMLLFLEKNEPELTSPGMCQVGGKVIVLFDESPSPIKKALKGAEDHS